MKSHSDTPSRWSGEAENIGARSSGVIFKEKWLLGLIRLLILQ